MNEEELFCKLFPEYVVNGKPLSPYFDLFESGYEQAENRITELETRCNELFLQTCEQAEKIKELNAEIENDRDLPAIAYMQGAEKQKKKDEEELKKWKDEWQEQVQKATDEGYARTLQTMQLTKATKIIKDLCGMVRELNKPNVQLTNIDYSLSEAEQFIKDSEVMK